MKFKNIIEKIRCRCKISCCLTKIEDEHIEIHLDTIKELEGGILEYKIGNKSVKITFV